MLDADQHALAVDVADAQHHHLAAAKAGAIRDAERCLVLEAGTGRGFEQPAHLVGGQNARQLPGIVRTGELVGEVGAPQRDGEEEAQRRGLRVHPRRLRSLLHLMGLEAAQIIPGRGVRRAPEELGKRFDVADIVGLRLVADGADGHVLDHAAAKIADGLLAHRGAPGPEVEVQQPLDPHDRALPIPLPPSPQTPPCALNLSAKLARSAFVP